MEVDRGDFDNRGFAACIALDRPTKKMKLIASDCRFIQICLVKLLFSDLTEATFYLSVVQYFCFTQKRQSAY